MLEPTSINLFFLTIFLIEFLASLDHVVIFPFVNSPDDLPCPEYSKAKNVTQERMYLETMEKVLADIDKVIIDKNSGSGVVPYLPLPELTKKSSN